MTPNELIAKMQAELTSEEMATIQIRNYADHGQTYMKVNQCGVEEVLVEDVDEYMIDCLVDDDYEDEEKVRIFIIG